MTITGKAVLVTGANRGIGQALVEEALSRGAKRVYAGTRQPLAHPDGRVTPLTMDVTTRRRYRPLPGRSGPSMSSSTTPESRSTMTSAIVPCSNSTWPSTSSAHTA